MFLTITILHFLLTYIWPTCPPAYVKQHEATLGIVWGGIGRLDSIAQTNTHSHRFTNGRHTSYLRNVRNPEQIPGCFPLRQAFLCTATYLWPTVGTPFPGLSQLRSKTRKRGRRSSKWQHVVIRRECLLFGVCTGTAENRNVNSSDCFVFAQLPFYVYSGCQTVTNTVLTVHEALIRK